VKVLNLHVEYLSMFFICLSAWNECVIRFPSMKTNIKTQ
jgi:hypothetical protein